MRSERSERSRGCASTVTRRELLRTAAFTLCAPTALALLTGCASRAAIRGREPSMELVQSRDGTRIAAWRSGNGPPLVLVHGTSADHSRWTGVLPALERERSVYAMDRRGRGGSGDTNAQSYELAREGEDVAALLDAIAARDAPADLVGHSYGAICSLEALRHTAAVRRLVLYEPPLPVGMPVSPPGVAERMRSLLEGGDREGALLLFFREVVRMPEQELGVFRTLPMWERRLALVHTVPRELAVEAHYRFEPEAFAHATLPVLLLLGGDSPPLFRTAIAAAQAALRGSRVVELPGQQHVAMDTAPELFVREVLEFLLA